MGNYISTGQMNQIASAVNQKIDSLGTKVAGLSANSHKTAIMTEAAYENLAEKDPQCIYFLT